MSRRENPFPGFMIVPGALLRDPAFARLTPAQRGGYFSLMLMLWEGGSIAEADLPRFSGLGDDWPMHRDALAPLFSKSHGKWSLAWLARYRKRAEWKSACGSRGADVTNRKLKELRESADGMVPTPSGSGSGSVHVHEAAAVAPTPAKGPADPAAALAARERQQQLAPEAVARLQAEYPARDVPCIVAKCLKTPRRNPESAVRAWCEAAEKRDTDRREPEPRPREPQEPLFTPEEERLPTPAEREAAARNVAEVGRLVDGVMRSIHGTRSRS